jgi:Zn-dependent protease with chaperone function
LRRILALVAALSLSGCIAPQDILVGYPQPPAPVDVAQPDRADARVAAANFVTAVERVEPVAEAYCRAQTRGVPCDFRIVIDDRPGQPPNAFQTLDNTGRPVIAFTLPLIAGARNMDEIAFIMGHEAAHHILGHIPISTRNAQSGAIMAGVLATLGGADEAGVRAAQDIGATVGARQFSKEFELQADALGTEIAFRAGFDPVRGAAFFTRLPDPGDRFLGSHPPNAERLATVRRTAAGLR